MRDESAYKVEWFSGTGKGGQHRNKHQNCCKLTHIPTGLKETRQGRSRENNYNDAIMSLNKKLDMHAHNKMSETLGDIRKSQIGSGMRGDKIRTYRMQDDIVVDHNSLKKSSANKILNGRFDLLW